MGVSYIIDESVDIAQNAYLYWSWVFLICNATSVGNWYSDVSAEGWVKVKARCLFEASEITNQVTRRHSPEGWNPRLHISDAFICVLRLQLQLRG